MSKLTADAVVIGAGINGASTAYNLIKNGLKNVVLLEKHLIASGGTGRSAAIIRQHYSNEVLVRIVRRSLDIFSNFNDEIGGECGFVNTGWSFLIPEYVSEGFKENIKIGQGLGVNVRQINREELLEIEPRIHIDDVDHIAFEPDSGYADPRATTHAYVRRFIDLGGRFIELTSATDVMRSNSAVTGVQTETGSISTEIVVNAAGPWAHHISNWVGVDLPLEITREEEIIYDMGDVGGPPVLCFSDMVQAIYYRPQGPKHMLVGRGFPKEYENVEPDNYNQEVNTSFISDVGSRLHHRWPTLNSIIAINSYTGLYDVTPDWHPVLGTVDELKGFYMCAGFSGHGFKLGPAIGEVMAEEILAPSTRSIDISMLNLRRFSRNELMGAEYGTNRA